MQPQHAATPVFGSRTWGFEACRSTENFALLMVVDNCLSAPFAPSCSVCTGDILSDPCLPSSLLFVLS